MVVRLRNFLRSTCRWQVVNERSPWEFVELILSHGNEAQGRFGTDDSLAPRLRSLCGDMLLTDDALITLATGIHLPTEGDVETREALLRLACAHWPSDLLEPFGGVLELTLTACGMSQEVDSSMHTALLTLGARDGTRHTFFLRASAETLLHFVERAGWHRQPRRGPLPAAIAAIRPPGGLGIGRVRLALPQLSSLRVGDALWLPPNERSDTAPISLVAGSRPVHLGHVQLASSQFLGWGSEGAAISNLYQAFSPPTEPRQVDALTVDLDFIVGRLAMTVGELSALSAGQVVQLDALLPAHVRIVAHGTELGSGQLVEIEGRLAVEIVEWGAPR